MSSQLNQNTNLTKYLLQDSVGDQEVGLFLQEFTQNDEVLKEIAGLLMSEKDLNSKQKQLVLEILKNTNKLLRTYGKKSKGLENYINNLRKIY